VYLRCQFREVNRPWYHLGERGTASPSDQGWTPSARRAPCHRPRPNAPKTSGPAPKPDPRRRLGLDSKPRHYTNV